ncbi:hypothetical protein ACWDA9_24225 [Streptomyces sp. NPDC001193]
MDDTADRAGLVDLGHRARTPDRETNGTTERPDMTVARKLALALAAEFGAVRAGTLAE